MKKLQLLPLIATKVAVKNSFKRLAFLAIALIISSTASAIQYCQHTLTSGAYTVKVSYESPSTNNYVIKVESLVAMTGIHDGWYIGASTGNFQVKTKAVLSDGGKLYTITFTSTTAPNLYTNIHILYPGLIQYTNPPSVTWGTCNPAPTFGTFTVPAKVVGDADFTITPPSSNSSGAFTYTSSNTNVATIVGGNQIRVVGFTGTSTISANQAANGGYSSGSTTATFTVTSALPTPVLTGFAVNPKLTNDADFTITPPTSDYPAGAVFTYTSSNTAVATIVSGNQIHLVGAAGSSTITAIQAFDANHTAASTTASLVVSVPTPTVSAPTPTQPAGNVISVFSNAYTPTANVNMAAFQNAAGSTMQITPLNDTRYYSNFHYAGNSFTAINLSSYVSAHLDVWSPNVSYMKFYLIGVAGGEAGIQFAVTPNSWNRITIPLSSYSTTIKNSVKELKYTNVNAAGVEILGGGILYFDNVYFSNTVPATYTTLWSNSAPTSTVDAVIDGNYDIATSITCKDLTINAGKTLTIGAGNTLTVTGNLNNNGSIVFKSDATSTAVFNQFIGTITGSGNVTVERYIPATQRAYRLLSPATTGGTIKANWQENQADGANVNVGYGTHLTGAGGSANGFDTTLTNAASVFTHNNTTPAWTALANTSGTLTAGTPYLVYVRGSRLASNINGSLTNDATALRTMGTLKTGDVVVSGLNAITNGFSVVGNPYQAQVDMQAVLASATNLNTAFYYVVDPSMGTKGAYLTVDVAAAATAHISKYLQPGQACFVNTLADGAASLTFTETNKSTAVVQTSIFKTRNVATPSLDITLYDGSLNRLDVLKVAFDASESNDVNQNDAIKLTNFDESMAISNSGKLLAIEKRAIPTTTDVIPLNITKYRGTSYLMKVQGSGLTETPYLVDAFTSTTAEIPVDGTLDYAYTVDAGNAATTDASRFKLIYAKTLKTNDNSVAGFTLYPNPSKSNSFNVVVPQSAGKASLTVSNLLGQILYSQKELQSGATAITVSNVKSAGVYLVILTSEGKTATTKWIVE
jgi:hypothetical protein